MSYHYAYTRLDDTSSYKGNVRMGTPQQPLRIVKNPVNLFMLENKGALSNYFFTVQYNNSTDNPALKTNHLETY